MKIQDMFAKDITRNIEGVIVVGDEDQANIKQELDEYVVTRETLKNFREFFDSYKKGIKGETTKTGVWISGFFGSGKSHFLKMLYYILDNRTVEGKTAIQYLTDNGQIKDGLLLADMHLAANTPTDAILFNIDSKSEQTGKQSEDAIVMVFLKVFNEMQGFYGALPYVADLERNLKEDGRLDDFMRAFERINNAPWKEACHKFDFIQDDIVDALVEIGYMSPEAARNWCEKTNEPYQISIENFAKMVKRYIDSKGKDHHVVFMVDEVGQYIGENSQMMLNLQTLQEELGKECRGKAWLIVTSQEDIDSITKVKGNDFSKIQGRFDTRISLSSANVDEVIKERILRKNNVGAQTLCALYSNVETQLSNIILFENTPEMKLYADENDFVDVYPFVPYQFHLLGLTLTSIRTHGASGKHLSEGARSMLALFKESAEAIKDESEGVIVPFYRFYDALEGFLDAAHSGVIQHALQNEKINPDGSDDCFTVNVLKCLFLIKYVKEMKNATFENITTLMISSVNENRNVLAKKVEDALDTLITEALVEKQGNTYIFLTEEEQEISREIDHMYIESGEVLDKISETIFDSIFSEKAFKYKKFNGRYTFPFNRFLDDRNYTKSNQTYDISVRVITPFSDMSPSESSYLLATEQERQVLVVLPEKCAYYDETCTALKIEKYLRKNTSSSSEKYSEIRAKKSKEMQSRLADAKQYLNDDLNRARIYVNGKMLQTSSKDITAKIDDALNALVEVVYHKLPYIEVPFSDKDIADMFSMKNQEFKLGDLNEANKMAQDEVLATIKNSSDSHSKISMKSIKDRFTKAPYGFVDDDVEWIVARLFKRDRISIAINGKQITTVNTSNEKLVDIFTKKTYVDGLMATYREKRSQDEIQNVKKLSRRLFDVSLNSDDEDSILNSFIKSSNDMLVMLRSQLQHEYQEPYPGQDVVQRGISLFNSICQLTDADIFYPQLLEMSGDLLDFADNYDSLKAFFSGEQRKIFDEALVIISLYNENKYFISDDDIAKPVEQISEILESQKPFKEIPKLPDLIKNFKNIYSKTLNPTKNTVIGDIKANQKKVLDRLAGKSFKEKYHDEFSNQFDELLNKAACCSDFNKLRGYADQAKNLASSLLQKIDSLDNEINPTPGVEDLTKREIRISIKSLLNRSQCRIESKDELNQFIEDIQKRLESNLGDGYAIIIDL